jgi:hypothetical protein
MKIIYFTISSTLISIIFSVSLIANVINVPGDQTTIQAGIKAAIDGDTVLVAPNTYYENINFNGKRIVVASHFILNQNRTFILSTIINGSIPSNNDTVSCVVINSGEDSTAVIQGFTITGGMGTKWVDPNLPAYTWRGGGGILTFISSPTIKNNLILNNDVINTNGVNGAQGGGILCYGGNPKIINNVITLNKARYGAGIVIDYSGAIIKNNIIYKNTGGQDYGGGGFWSIGNGSSPIVLENNHIVENAVTGSGTYGGKGGGMFVWMGNVTVRNNIIWGNTQSQGGPIAEIEGGNAAITYSNVEGGFTGTGNINLNPAFSDTNLCLSDLSVCVDAGNPAISYNDREDPYNSGFALFPSLGGLRNDMGAYGGPNAELLPDFENVSQIGVLGNSLVPSSVKIYQNYPNPFNPVTQIKYEIPVPGFVSLKVFNLSGCLVATLVNEYQPTGNYKVDFDGSELASNLYFYKLTAGSYTETKKMVLLK